jgi:hypothetical protein
MADWSDDTNFFWQSKYGHSERNQTAVDGSDALANGGKFVISFLHLASGKEVFFKAFITNYAENFNSEWKSETVFGRTDPIVTYAGTRRVVSLGFDVPASSEQEAYENMGRLQKLAQFQYPTYFETGDSVDSAQREYTIGQSPLVRIKVMNLIQKDLLPREDLFGPDLLGDLSRSRLFGSYGLNTSADAEQGLLSAINNISINTDFTNHAVFEKTQNTVLPQNFEVTVDFNVIHEKTIGFDLFGDALNPGMPYGVTLKRPNSKEKVDAGANPEKRIQLERDRQAAEDIAASRFRGALGGKRAQRAINRYERKSGKGKADDFDAALASEAQTYLDSE